MPSSRAAGGTEFRDRSPGIEETEPGSKKPGRGCGGRLALGTHARSPGGALNSAENPMGTLPGGSARPAGLTRSWREQARRQAGDRRLDRAGNLPIGGSGGSRPDRLVRPHRRGSAISRSAASLPGRAANAFGRSRSSPAAEPSPHRERHAHARSLASTHRARRSATSGPETPTGHGPGSGGPEERRPQCRSSRCGHRSAP